VGRAISSTLTGVSSFSLNAKVSGNLDDYTMQLSSDLDRVLKDSVRAQLKDQIAKLEQELRADISERVSGPIEQAKSSLGDFAPLGDELEKRLQDFISLQKEAIFKKPSGGLPIP
jgi:phage portal protein BeeE